MPQDFIHFLENWTHLWDLFIQPAAAWRWHPSTLMWFTCNPTKWSSCKKKPTFNKTDIVGFFSPWSPLIWLWMQWNIPTHSLKLYLCITGAILFEWVIMSFAESMTHWKFVVFLLNKCHIIIINEYNESRLEHWPCFFSSCAKIHECASFIVILVQ